MIETGRVTIGHVRAEAGDFIRRVWNKADQDQIFFMASAIAFNVLVAIVPLALAALGVTGLIFRHMYLGDQTERVEHYLLRVLPNISPDFMTDVSSVMKDIIANSKGVTIFGILTFVWLSTRLIGTLRTALREIFDLQSDRPIIAGKIFDIKMVILAGSLLALSLGVTLLVTYLANRGRALLGVTVTNLGFWNMVLANVTAFVLTWTMFLLIYRYLPARRIQWRTAIISATFAATMFEILKRLFTLYAARPGYGALYGALAFAAILVIWVYYTAIAFILGGEVGQVWTLRRIRRRQKERLG